MSDEIKAGEVVLLKSGGPRMTVSTVEDGYAYVDWFEGKEPRQGKFACHQLQIFTPPKHPSPATRSGWLDR